MGDTVKTVNNDFLNNSIVLSYAVIHFTLQ